MKKQIQCPNCKQYRMLDQRRVAIIVNGIICFPTAAIVGIIAIGWPPAAVGAWTVLGCGIVLLIVGAKWKGPLKCSGCGYEIERSLTQGGEKAN